MIRTFEDGKKTGTQKTQQAAIFCTISRASIKNTEHFYFINGKHTFYAISDFSVHVFGNYDFVPRHLGQRHTARGLG